MIATARMKFASEARLERDRAWFMRLYGEITPSFSEGIVDRTGAQTMLYLSCTMISNVDLAPYGLSRNKDWIYVDCGTSQYTVPFGSTEPTCMPLSGHFMDIEGRALLHQTERYQLSLNNNASW